MPENSRIAGETIVIAPHDPARPVQFRLAAARMRAALGDLAVRIDQIGATSVPGLAAQPVIDVHIATASFEPLEAFGYRYRADNPDLTKRYFREAEGARSTHGHVRRHGRWSGQLSMLFRYGVRRHPDAATRYADLRRSLAVRYSANHRGCAEAKAPFIGQSMIQDGDWSQATR